MNFRTKFLRHTLLPFLLGILITALFTFIMLNALSPNLIQRVKEDSTERELNGIIQSTESIAMPITVYIQKMYTLTDLIGSLGGDLFRKINEGNKQYVGVFPPFISAIDYSLNRIDPKFKGIYDNGLIHSPNNLFPDTPEYRRRMEFFEELNPFIKTLTNDNRKEIDFLYVIFQDDGLTYNYPALNGSYYTTPDKSCLYDSTYFDFRCRDWYNQVKYYYDNGWKDVTMTLPYEFIQSGNQRSIGMTVCFPYFKNLSDNSKEDVKETMKRILAILNGETVEELVEETDDELPILIICIDFLLNDLDTIFKRRSHIPGYFYISSAEGQLMYHSKFSLDHSLVGKNILDIEFGKDNEGKEKFLTNIVPKLFQPETQGTTSLQFQKQGKDYIISTSTIKLGVKTNNYLPVYFANIAYVIEISDIFLPFDHALDTINKSSFYIIMTFISMIFFISYLSFKVIDDLTDYVVSPIEDLNAAVQKMLNNDLYINIRCEYEPNCIEIRELYNTFSRLKNLLLYANADFYSGNDSAALISYANALNLYKDVKNYKRIGLVLSNMGNIHFKSGRYSEAIAYYRQAVSVAEIELVKVLSKNQQIAQKVITYLPKEVGSSLLITQNKMNIKSLNFIPRSRRRMKDKLDNILGQNNEQIKIFEEIYLNRIFQLARGLYMQAHNEEKYNLLEEAVILFQKIANYDVNTKENSSRLLRTLLKMGNSFIFLKNLSAAEITLNYAEKSLATYERMFELKEDFDEKQMFVDLNPDLLYQKLYYYKGLLHEKKKNFKTSVTFFTKCLTVGKIYDPLYRENCLEKISSIFAANQIYKPMTTLNKLLSKFDKRKQKNVLFLLDYSASMAPHISQAISQILKIIEDYIHDDDRFSLIKFNSSIEILFEMTIKGRNIFQILNMIIMLNNPIGTALLYDSLYCSVKALQKFKNDEEENWLIIFTGGQDIGSKKSIEDVKGLISNTNFKSIFFDMSEDNLLKSISESLKNSFYLSSLDAQNIDLVYNQMKAIEKIPLIMFEEIK